MTGNGIKPACATGGSGNDLLAVYNSAFSSGVLWTPTTAAGTCYTVNLTDGFANLWIVPGAKDCAISTATISWTTINASGANTCAAVSCSNNIQDGSETGVDCGGTCPACSGSTDYITGATQINSCGTSFVANNAVATNSYNATTAGCGTVYNNLDCNTTTSVSGTGGQDVDWSIENNIWYKFCPASTGVWTISVTGNCNLTGGYQMGIFQGTPSNLSTQFYVSPCTAGTGLSCTKSLTGTTTITINVTSTVNCVYVTLDGHAGANCNFGVNLSTASCILLPVDLVSFDVNRVGDMVYVTWITSTEIENNYFDIERSVDAINFEQVGREYSKGNSSSKKIYTYKYLRPPVGLVYYRLKQVDYSGKITYSPIKSISLLEEIKGFDFNIFPNPIEDAEIGFNLRLFGSKNEKLYLKLFSSAGLVIKEDEIILDDYGFKLLTLDGYLEKGVYIVKVFNEYGRYIHKKLIVK